MLQQYEIHHDGDDDDDDDIDNIAAATNEEETNNDMFDEEEGGGEVALFHDQDVLIVNEAEANNNDLSRHGLSENIRLSPYPNSESAPTRSSRTITIITAFPASNELSSNNTTITTISSGGDTIPIQVVVDPTIGMIGRSTIVAQPVVAVGNNGTIIVTAEPIDETTVQVGRQQCMIFVCVMILGWILGLIGFTWYFVTHGL